ncbi:MAG TPA: hypothetical protein VD737_00495 [Steroidobacteraceae bacterium]|nr:hypothetical protein [Steroidobacteraceae bacterium]
MAASTSVGAPLAASLNEACHCIWVDRAKLRRQLQADLGQDAGVLDTREGLVSGNVVFIAPQDAARMDGAIVLITRALESEAFQAKAAGAAPAIARARPLASGGLLGFDFHLGGPVPQLIEINTNPGGLLIAFELARAATASCDCLAAPLPQLTAAGVALDRLAARVVEGFRAEWTRARGAGPPLETIAIVDDDPRDQYLYPEFLLYRNLLERSGLRVLVADPAELTASEEALLCRGERIDLVYNRLTDFYLADDRHAALRQAYVRDLVVVTPHPAAHARWADKRLLAWLRDVSMLEDAGLSGAERRAVLEAIPPTEIVEPCNAGDLWARRKTLFFKPIDGFAGKAAYRGDGLTRTAFEHVLSHRYIAQAIAPTSFRRVAPVDGTGTTELRVDVRNFAAHGETWLRAARLYRGQTTNFRTAGGGFAPVLTLRS